MSQHKQKEHIMINTVPKQRKQGSESSCENCALLAMRKRTLKTTQPPRRNITTSIKQTATVVALLLLVSIFGSIDVRAHDTGTDHVDCTKLYLPLVNGSSGQQTQPNDNESSEARAADPCVEAKAEDAARGIQPKPVGTVQVQQPSVQPAPTAINIDPLVALDQSVQGSAPLTEPRREDYGIQRLPLSWDITNTEPFWISVPEGCLDSNHALFDADLGCNDTPNWGGPNGDVQLFDPFPRPHIYYWSEHKAPNGQIYENAAKAWIACNQAKDNPGNFDCIDYGVQRLPYPDQSSTEPFWIGMPFGCRLPTDTGYNPDFVCHDENNPVVLNGNTYFDPVERPDSTANDFYYFSRRLVGDALIVEDHNCAALELTDSGYAFKNSAHADCFYRAAYKEYERNLVAFDIADISLIESFNDFVALTISRGSTSNSETFQLEILGPVESTRSAATRGDDFDLFTTDDISPDNILGSNQITFAAGESSKTLYLHAYLDESVEVPEIARIRLFPDGVSTGTALDEIAITVRDNEPGITSTSKLFSTELRLVPECKANTNPGGYSVMRLSNDNSYANLFLSFDNLSSPQVADDPAHIHFDSILGDDVTVFNLPAGELSPIEGDPPHILLFQDLQPSGDLVRDQHVLDALFSGQLYVNIHTGTSDVCDTQGEISGHYTQLLNASIDFDQSDLPKKPEIEPLANEAEIKRDIVRFLTQATFGPTETEVKYLLGQINADDSNRIQVYSAWIDAQIQEAHPSMLDFSNAVNFAWHDKVRPEDFGIQRLPMEYGATGHVFPIPHLGEENYGSSKLEKPNTEPYWIGTPEVCESGWPTAHITGITVDSQVGLVYPKDVFDVNENGNTQEELRSIKKLGFLEDTRDIDGDGNVEEKLSNIMDVYRDVDGDGDKEGDVDGDGDVSEAFVIAAKTPLTNKTVTLGCHSVALDENNEPKYEDPLRRPFLYASTPRMVDGEHYENAEAAWAKCAGTATYESDSSCPNPKDYGIQLLSTADGNQVFWIGMPEVCREVYDAKYQPSEGNLFCNTTEDPIASPFQDFYGVSPKKVDDKIATILDLLEAPKYINGTYTGECGYLIHVDSNPDYVRGKYFTGPDQANCFYEKALNASHGGFMNRRVSNDAAWFTSAVYAKAQLRERIAFALSETMVVSSIHAQLVGNEAAVAGYYDVLKDGAFGSYEELLYNVSLNPAMGHYLSMLNNAKESNNSFPDENYAREIMQLFSVGLLELHPDGTVALDAATYLPTRTYTQTHIYDLARIFTGWTYSQQPIENLIATSAIGFEDLTNDDSTSWGKPSRFPNAGNHQWSYPRYIKEPMRNFDTWHDTTTPKTYFDLFNIPPADVTGLDAKAEMARVIEELASHQNVGPFIARRLIQRLVTSNPSRRYIFDVTLAFRGDLDNDGAVDEGKTYGDLGALTKAILLHPEARNLSYTERDDYGKVKEYLVQYVSLLRLLQPTTQFGLSGKVDEYGQETCNAVGAINASGVNFDPYIGQATSKEDCYPLSRLWEEYGLSNDLDDDLPNYSEIFETDANIVFAESRTTIADFEQSPLHAPSVFNWFEPDYIPVGEMAALGLTAPELQHVSENNIIGFYNKVSDLLNDRTRGRTPAFYSGHWLNTVRNQAYQAKIKVSLPSLFSDLGVSENFLRELDLYACVGQLYAEESPPSIGHLFAGTAYRILEQAISNTQILELLGDTPDDQMRTLIYLVSTSPQCRVQK